MMKRERDELKQDSENESGKLEEKRSKMEPLAVDDERKLYNITNSIPARELTQPQLDHFLSGSFNHCRIINTAKLPSEKLKKRASNYSKYNIGSLYSMIEQGEKENTVKLRFIVSLSYRVEFAWGGRPGEDVPTHYEMLNREIDKEGIVCLSAGFITFQKRSEDGKVIYEVTKINNKSEGLFSDFNSLSFLIAILRASGVSFAKNVILGKWEMQVEESPEEKKLRKEPKEVRFTIDSEYFKKLEEKYSLKWKFFQGSNGIVQRPPEETDNSLQPIAVSLRDVSHDGIRNIFVTPALRPCNPKFKPTESKLECITHDIASLENFIQKMKGDFVTLSFVLSGDDLIFADPNASTHHQMAAFKKGSCLSAGYIQFKKDTKEVISINHKSDDFSTSFDSLQLVLANLFLNNIKFFSSVLLVRVNHQGQPVGTFKVTTEDLKAFLRETYPARCEAFERNKKFLLETSEQNGSEFFPPVRRSSRRLNFDIISTENSASKPDNGPR